MIPRISELSIENVRCFCKPQEARLGRITLLVGENNVGKSTFMACYNAFAHLSRMSELDGDHPFDAFPFFMGDYDSISRPGESSFSISGKYDYHIHSAARFRFGRADKGKPFEEDVAFTFVKEGEPSVRIRIAIEKRDGEDTERLSFCGPNFVYDMNWAEISYLPISTWLSHYVGHGYLPYNGNREIFLKRRGVSVTSEEIDKFGKFINFLRSDMPFPKDRCFDVRTLKPDLPTRRRIYRKIPYYLSDYEKTDRISRIGIALNLWEKIEVLGADSGRGMEVRISIDGESYNLMDVGYGVHSLLPLVYDISATDSPSIFLLQQPETYVYPSAQARLAQYMSEGPHDFIIETHSDHLMDRFRLCVMEQILRPEELSILYFEKSKDRSKSKIHCISVDSQANLIDPPDSYREFNLNETERLLGLI